MNLAILAGSTSTILFAVSYLPMLLKAARTKDLASYSLGNIAMGNLANVVHSVYVFSLPIGPIWFLHTFYLVTSLLMLVWFIRFRPGPSLGHQAYYRIGGTTMNNRQYGPSEQVDPGHAHRT
ncbi:MAG: hypothetical protein WED09_04490 [Homoserinimonas sp.]